MRLVEQDAPSLPGEGWHRVDPLLSGICGSDLATLDGRSSRYFEEIVSFPFVPGHEVVGLLSADAVGADGSILVAGTRVVLQPVLGCAARGIDPPCAACQAGHVGNCGYLAFGHIRPGLQTGFCADTGGGWSTTGLVAHASQLFAVPEGFSDADAVTIEPVACAVHAVLGRRHPRRATWSPCSAPAPWASPSRPPWPTWPPPGAARPAALLVGAKYGHQQRLAREFGATEALPPDQLARAVRRHSHSLSFGGTAGETATLSGGADVVIDCVGSAESISQSLAMVRPRGTVALVGMPGKVTIDLAPLWHREVRLAGAYAYGTESVPAGARRRVLPPPGRAGPRQAQGGRRSQGGQDRRGHDSVRGGHAQLSTFALAFEVVAAAVDRPPGLGHLPPRPIRGGGGPRRRGRAARGRQDRLRHHERTHPMSRRPGFVLEVDKSTPPTLFWNGEGFTLETLPEGSRVIYAPEPMKALDDPYGAIRHALLHPVGDRDPLPALLHAGMKLTICFDDISLPLPPMEAPDIRQMVIETVLDMAADAGVDDVMLIAALALHRRMTEDELRHALGDRVYDAFAPHGLLTQHDAEDPDNLIHLGQTDSGEDIEINKRAATSDLLVYVNINLVAMDGGHKSVATGLASYQSLRHHHNPQTMQHSRSFMDAPASELHSSNWRMGRFIAEAGVKIFQIETTLNTDTFPSSFSFLQKREWEWNLRDRATFAATSPLAQGRATAPGPPDLPLHRVAPCHDLGPGRRGRGGPRHHHGERVEAAGGRRAGPDRHPDVGPAVHLPLQRQLDHEPDPGGLSRAWGTSSTSTGVSHSCARAACSSCVTRPGPSSTPATTPVTSTSTSRCSPRPSTPSPSTSSSKSPSPPTRGTSTSTAPVTRTTASIPSTCGTGAPTRSSISGRVIIVGGDPKAVRRLGFSPASSLNDALEIASDVVGTLPHPDPPARPPDHDGGRALMARSARVLGLRGSRGVGAQAQRLVGRARAIRFPLAARRGRRPLSGRTPSASSDSSTTTSGLVAIRPVWLGPWSWTTWPARWHASSPRPLCAAWSTSATWRVRSSSPPITPATSTPRSC